MNISTIKGPWRRLGHKLKWVLIALLAPEVTVFIAFSQFLEAWWLSHRLTELKKKRDDSHKGDLNYPMLGNYIKPLGNPEEEKVGSLFIPFPFLAHPDPFVM